MEKTENSVNFFEVERRHDISVTSLACTGVNKSFICVTMHTLKAPINVLFRCQAPKTQQIAATDMREKPVDFLMTHQL